MAQGRKLIEHKMRDVQTDQGSKKVMLAGVPPKIGDWEIVAQFVESNSGDDNVIGELEKHKKFLTEYFIFGCFSLVTEDNNGENDVFHLFLSLSPKERIGLENYIWSTYLSHIDEMGEDLETIVEVIKNVIAIFNIRNKYVQVYEVAGILNQHCTFLYRNLILKNDENLDKISESWESEVKGYVEEYEALKDQMLKIEGALSQIYSGRESSIKTIISNSKKKKKTNETKKSLIEKITEKEEEQKRKEEKEKQNRIEDIKSVKLRNNLNQLRKGVYKKSYSSNYNTKNKLL